MGKPQPLHQPVLDAKTTENWSEERKKEFEELYIKYWTYIYKYEVGYEEDFKPNKPWYKREDFNQQLNDEGMTIKVSRGY